MPTTISHGSFSLESHLDDVTQVRYTSSDCEDKRQGYMEILHVRNPPPGKQPFLVHYRMHFPEYDVVVRFAIQCPTREVADKVWEELSKKWGNFRELMSSNRICGQEVRRLPKDGEHLPWVYEPEMKN